MSANPKAVTPSSVNHIAYCTGNMKDQLEFYTSVVGMKLEAIFWMHGVEGAFHAFLTLNPTCSLSFVYHPDVENLKPVMGVSHVANTISLLPGGAQQHVAFQMDSVDDVKAMIERVRSFGYMVSDIIDHDFCQSAYMLAPENMWIEFTTNVRDFKEVDIDPEVLKLCGIDDAELAKMMNPNEELKANEATLSKGKAQSELMKQRMTEMIKQMQAKGQQKFDTEYKH
jgi:catechol 2,3-dioxygenase-like lactoylglutathione lyase family enzyme